MNCLTLRSPGAILTMIRMLCLLSKPELYGQTVQGQIKGKVTDPTTLSRLPSCILVHVWLTPFWANVFNGTCL
jgi:hypothetical protein